MLSKQLIEKQNQLVAVQEKVDGIFQQAKVEGSDQIDLSKVKKIGEVDISAKSYTTVQIAEEIRKLDQEMVDVGKEVDSACMAVEKASKHNDALKARLFDASGNPLPQPRRRIRTTSPSAFRGLGHAIVSSAAFKAYQEDEDSGKDGRRRVRPAGDEG